MDISMIAQRIKTMREILNISESEMAKATELSIEDYVSAENGKLDFTLTFLLKCAQKFKMDVVDLMSGSSPNLTFFTVVRNGEGLPFERRRGFTYSHIAYLLKDKLIEPFIVTAPFASESQDIPMVYSTHAGQELDFIIKGSLKLDLDGHVLVLNEGDSVLYDSGHPHGMLAVGGSDCKFLAVVIPKP